MPHESYSETDLRNLLQSYKDGLQYWQQAIGGPDATAIKLALVSDPLAELVKLAKVIHAMATKIGIVFKPGPIPTTPAYKQVKEASEKTVLLVLLVGQVSVERYSSMFAKEMVARILAVLAACERLAGELQEMDYAAESSSGDERLVLVGRVWETSTAVVELAEMGKRGLLASRVKQLSAMLADSLEELAEWCEDPHMVDEDDPFGLDENSAEEQEVDSAVVSLASAWTQKLKLVRLLTQSLTKSLPSDANLTGAHIDTVQKCVLDIEAAVDDVVAAFMTGKLVEECNEEAAVLLKACNTTVAFVRLVNKNSDSKTKWCNAWEAKWKE